MKICGVDSEDLADMIGEIKALDPKPGATYDAEPVRTVVPDILMRAAPDGGWLLELNPDTMPRVLVNESFFARVSPKAKKEERVFLTEHLASANWLVRSLQQRAQTILKVAAEIMRTQDAFLRQGVAYLRPPILRDIATAVEMHESTVSRVTSNKYISTPRGMFELKYFFNRAISKNDGEEVANETVKTRLAELIKAEDAVKPYSDQQILELLAKENIEISRRTIAKYREQLGILPSSKRRKPF